jgi:acetyltransferase-like isoleucine patch superfamily enzyme
VRDDFLSPDEVSRIGFAAVGGDVRISRHALFFAPERIRIGDHCRIDAFVILSAGFPGLRIGSHVHINAYSGFFGRAAIDVGDFCTFAQRCLVYSSNDDYSGETLTNSTVPDALRGSRDAPVSIGTHVIVGSGSVILAGVTIGDSSAVGALSLVKDDVEPFVIVAGIPARAIGERDRGHLDLAERVSTDQSRRGE